MFSPAHGGNQKFALTAAGHTGSGPGPQGPKGSEAVT
jgi:hypothetical protein